MLKKTFLTMAFICLPHLISTQSLNNLVKESYPHAYQWYLDMSEKYPDAKLSSIEFCISDHHHAKNNSIYFPLSSIELIDQSYKSDNKSDIVLAQLAQEEYLLLHESCHILGGDYEKGEFLKKTVIASGLIAQLTLLIKNFSGVIDFKEATLKGVATAAALSAGIISYAQSQEKNADNFANTQADKKALEAGIDWHKKNKEELNLDQSSSDLKNAIIEQSYDLAHPRPTERQKDAEKTYDQRFSKIDQE